MIVDENAQKPADSTEDLSHVGRIEELRVMRLRG